MTVIESQSSNPQTPIPNISNIEKQQNDEQEVDGGYGWIVMVSMLLITAHTWGINGVGTPPSHLYSNPS